TLEIGSGTSVKLLNDPGAECATLEVDVDFQATLHLAAQTTHITSLDLNVNGPDAKVVVDPDGTRLLIVNTYTLWTDGGGPEGNGANETSLDLSDNAMIVRTTSSTQAAYWLAQTNSQAH